MAEPEKNEHSEEQFDELSLEELLRGAREEILGKIEAMGPLFVETVPLTLEEVFIHEMEAVGYDYSNILF